MLSHSRSPRPSWVLGRGRKHYSLNYPQFLCSRGFSKEQTYSLSSFSPFCVGLGAELYRRKCTYDQFIIIIITKLTSETLLLFCMSNPIVDVHLVSCLVCFWLLRWRLHTPLDGHGLAVVMLCIVVQRYERGCIDILFSPFFFFPL